MKSPQQIQKINLEALMDKYLILSKTDTKPNLWLQFYERKQNEYVQLTGVRYK